MVLEKTYLVLLVIIMSLMTMVLYSEVDDNSGCYRGKRMVMWHVNECTFVYKVTSTISLLCR